MILDFLFPKFCLECKKGGKYICLECLSKVLDGTFDENNYSIFKYKGIVRQAIITLKYKFAYDVCDELVDCCIDRLKSTQFHNVLLVPIPLFWQRKNFRGFNQSEVLGKKIAEKLDWGYVPDLLIRSKKAKPQVGLKGAIRLRNLVGVFDVNPNCVISHKSPVLLFDDVYTTGSTMKEAKKVLLNAGFKKVFSLTVAR